MSILEIVLYILISLGVLFYVVASIYKIKTGKSLLKRKKKDDKEQEEEEE